MAIRRREKPLTPAEAIDQAKKQLIPFWFGSEPLMAGARDTTGGARAYPLDSRMTDRPWLLIFVDPLSLSAREILAYTQVWAERYEAQKLGVMLVLRLSAAEFTQESSWGSRLSGGSNSAASAVVTVMDTGHLLQESFHVQELPKMILLQQNQILFQKSGKEWFANTELDLQRFFRKADPGLPLFEAMEGPKDPVTELPSIDFGVPTQALSFSGAWTTEKDRWVTNDPQATISFECTGRRFGIIAQSLAAPEEAEIVVELPGEYSRDGLVDEDLSLNLQVLSNPMVDPIQKKRATLRLGYPRLYTLFRALPVSHRKMILRFSAAEKAGVAVYGFRFGD